MSRLVPPYKDKIASRLDSIISKVDVVLGNFADAILANRKGDARRGSIETAKQHVFGSTEL